jgi:RND family efflux transporter MFP subunit
VTEEPQGAAMDDAPPPPRPRGRILLVGAALAILGAGAAAFWWSSRAEVNASPTEPAAPPPVTVALPLRKELVEWDEFTGRFEAVERVEIRARVGGYLDEVHFSDGDLVERGQLLFTIDPRPFRIAADQARAAVEAAAARLELARLEVRRAEQLRGGPALAEATYDERLQASLQATAELEGARAALQAAELELGFTQVLAPVAGRISNRRVDVGNLVGDDTMLTTIVSLDPIHFVFDMSEADFLAYQRAVLNGNFPSTRDQETPVGINLVDEQDWRREGRMNFVDNVVDAGSGTVRARAVLQNPDLLIAPGQFGEIRIPGSPLYPALLIPDEAIVTDQNRKLVMVVDAQGLVEPRVIRPGPREYGLRIVRDGLEGGERVIINGLLRARPGGQVTAQPGEIALPLEFSGAEAGQ